MKINVIPFDIIDNILSFMDIYNNYIFVVSNKEYYQNYYQIIKQDIIKSKKIILKIPRDIAKIFGDYKEMLKYPILKWKNCFLDDYKNITNIKINDVNTSIMIGYDNIKERAFIVIKTNIIKHINFPQLTTQIDTIYPKNNVWITSSSQYGIFSDTDKPIYNNKLIHSNAITNLKNLIENKDKFIILKSTLDVFHSHSIKRDAAKLN